MPNLFSFLNDESMKSQPLQICKFAGFLFMAVCTVLFYNSLLVAHGNPGFFTWIYFNAYNEGLIELLIFILLLPFIALTIVIESFDMYKLIQNKKV